MTVNEISSVITLPGADLLASAQPGQTGNFAAWLKDEWGQVNQRMARADIEVQRLASGNSDNLHQVMIALEEAKISFQLMLQVRNKLLDAYQDIARMQI